LIKCVFWSLKSLFPLRFYFSRKKNNYIPAFKRVYERSVILEYFSRIFRIFTRVSLSCTKFFTLFQDVSKSLRERRNGVISRYNTRDTILLSWSALSVAKIAFSHLSKEIKKKERSDDLPLRVYFITCRLYMATPRALVILGLFLNLAAWNLSQSIFLCFCSPLQLYTCKGSRKDSSRQTMLAGSVQANYTHKSSWKMVPHEDKG